MSSIFNLMRLMSLGFVTLLLAGKASAFDESVKRLANTPQAMAFSQKYAESVDMSIYGTCANASIEVGVMWARGELDENTQLMWQMLTNGLGIYRVQFIVENPINGSKIIDDYLRSSNLVYLQSDRVKTMVQCAEQFVSLSGLK